MSFGDNYFSTRVYTIPFVDFYCSSTAGASYADLWSVKGTTVGRTIIRDINIGQLSTNTAGNQQLGVQLQRGTTLFGTTAAVTPVSARGWSNAQAAASLAYAPVSTAVASTASATVIYADNTDWSGNWVFPATDKWGPFTFDAGQRFVLRVSTPPVGVKLSGTMVIEEVLLKSV